MPKQHEHSLISAVGNFENVVNILRYLYSNKANALYYFVLTVYLFIRKLFMSYFTKVMILF